MILNWSIDFCQPKRVDYFHGEKEIEITEKFKYAINQATKGRNLFITGRAGTGKSTLLRIIKEKLEDKKVISIVAPTGVLEIGKWFANLFNIWDTFQEQKMGSLFLRKISSSEYTNFPTKTILK